MECVVPAEGCLEVCVMEEISVLGGNWKRFEEALPSAGSLGEEQDMYTVSFLPSLIMFTLIGNIVQFKACVYCITVRETHTVYGRRPVFHQLEAVKRS